MANPIDDTVPLAAVADDDDEPGSGDDDLRRLLAGVAHAPPQPPPATAGDRVGRYVLIRRIGAGGMGVVFAAYDPQLDRRVAIKLLRAELVATPGSNGRERTLREARALARLIHPGIVAVHDAGFHRGELYIVMELVEGESVRDWLAASPRAVAAIVDVFRQAAIGLGAAHAQQMVHRDFKPDNVLIGKDGRVRVADFGLVHIADASNQDSATANAPDGARPAAGPAPAKDAPFAATPALTVTGAFMGTPAYMAPEQLDGLDVDARADQYAFGLSLWGALFGASPWKTTELGPRRKEMAAGPPTEPATTNPVPAWLRAIVRRTLAPAPVDRFLSMTAVVAAIDRGLSRRRRLTAALAGGAITALVAGAIAVSTFRTVAPAPCGDGPALIADGWGPGRAGELRARLVARGVDARAFDPLLGRLDDYARSWVRGHREACRATRIERSQTEEVLDQRMACLDVARLSMRAVAAAIADGKLDDPGQRAVGDDLPALDSCADRDSLRGSQPRPTTLAADQLDTAVAQMLDAKLAVYEVRRADGTLRSEAALRVARATGWAPLISDAALIHGELLRLDEHYDQARPFYDEALREGLRGSPSSAQAEVMASLGYLELLRDHREEAQQWIDRAMALLTRLHRPHDLELLVLDDAFAVALATSDLVHARAFADREVALTADLTGVDRRRHAEALLDAGRLAAADGRYADAVTTIDQAIATAAEALGAENPWLAYALEQELEPLIALGRTADARAAVERAIALRRPVFGADDPMAVELLSMLGAIAQKRGDLASARAAFEQALPRKLTLHGHDSIEVAMAIANLAMVDESAGDHARAEASALEAEAIFEAKAGPDAPELLNLLVLRAYAARGQRRFADARTHLERARAISIRALGADHPDTANILVELAHTDRLDGHLAAAIAGYRAVVGRTDLPPPTLAEAGFGLARAAWDHGERAAARAAADTAANTYHLLGADFAGQHDEVEAWLTAHPAP